MAGNVVTAPGRARLVVRSRLPGPRAHPGGSSGPALAALLAQLVPPDAARAQQSADDIGQDTVLARYTVLPGTRRPRLLLPGGDGSRAARLLAARFDRGGSALRQLGRGLAAAGLRTGLVPALAGGRVEVLGLAAGAADVFLGAHLAEVFGEPVLLTGSVRSRDPHSSQVLQAVATDGRTLGFVKLAGTPLTRELLRSEAAALRRCAAAGSRLRHVVAPRVVHAGRWHALELLVTSALDLDRRAVASRAEPPPLPVTLEIAATGTRCRTPLAASSYLRSTAQRVAGAAVGDGVLAAGLREALHRLSAVPAELDFGGWHGDWVPWNFSPAGRAYAVWDWEYAGPDAPVGFDLLHFFFGIAFFRDRSGFGAAVAAAARSGLPLLDRHGLTPAAARLTLALYTVEMALRRCDIRAAGGGSDDIRVFPEARGVVASVTREATESYPS